jgi:isopenicillin N synthase-like dioxygenase
VCGRRRGAAARRTNLEVVRVRPVEGTLVVNLGDMMQAMSGGAYLSVEHRVVAPPLETERMSFCYFALPDSGPRRPTSRPLVPKSGWHDSVSPIIHCRLHSKCNDP